MRRLLYALVLGLALPACSSAGATVDMTSGQRFEPSEIEVRSGETITFSNGSGEAHTVTAYQEALPDDADYFSSGGFPDERSAREDLSQGLIEPGGAFALTLEAPGTYRYFCIPHEQAGMLGTIVVHG